MNSTKTGHALTAGGVSKDGDLLLAGSRGGRDHNLDRLFCSVCSCVASEKDGEVT